MQFRREELVESWDEMKEKLRQKYIPPSFSQQLWDKWNMLTQGNMSATDYIIKFDVYLNRCSAIELKSPEQCLGSGQVLGTITAKSS